MNLTTLDDFNLVHKLLKTPRYEIPERLRHKVVINIEKIIDHGEDDRTQIAAMKVLADFDKINLDIVKLAMPKKIEHFDPSKANDDELLVMVKKIVKQLPTVLEGDYDTETYLPAPI